MGGDSDSRGGEPRINAAAKALCLVALRAGARVADMAVALKVRRQAFKQARKRDPEFDAAWREAHAASAAAERGLAGESFSGFAGPPTGEAAGRNEVRIVANNRRGLQRRMMRHVKFDEARQQAFLAHFSWSCDMLAAAAEAGVSESTVSTHRRKNPAFAAEFDAALEQGYVRLEAEALRQRLVTQERLRAAVESAEEPPSAELAGDLAAEFERVMKLLARWDRKPRRPDREASPGSPRRVWTFDAAVELLDKRLRALGVAIPVLPPEVAARYDGPGARSGEGGAEA